MASKKSHAVPVRRQCGTMAVHHRLLERTDYQQQQLAIEGFTNRFMLFGGARARVGPLQITVVVHVVYRTADENIADAQIHSQIDALNRDYSGKNADASKVPAPWKTLVTSPEVRFALARKDPKGKKTPGITRTQTTQSSFDLTDNVKSAASGGAPAWPAAKYLNLWVCTLGNQLLGYAQFPGGPPATDGVVILNRAFGTKGSAGAPFNLGRTATHEIGHWLNLHHIWGDRLDCGGSDLVDDTPKAQRPNYGKPKFPHISCNNGPNGDMFVNYMDYVDDDAMVMFTAGQVARMNATLEGPRSGIGKPVKA